MSRTQPGTTLGRLIRDARENARPRVRQSDAAQYAGVSTNTISLWERQALDDDVRLPDWNNLIQLMATLGFRGPEKEQQVMDAWLEIVKYQRLDSAEARKKRGEEPSPQKELIEANAVMADYSARANILFHGTDKHIDEAHALLLQPEYRRACLRVLELESLLGYSV